MVKKIAREENEVFGLNLRSHDQTGDRPAETRTLAPVRPRPRRDGRGRKNGALDVSAAQNLKITIASMSNVPICPGNPEEALQRKY